MFTNKMSWTRDLFHRIFTSPLIRRIIKNTSYLFSATGISAVFSLVQGILAARLLGPASFGVLGTITVFTSTVNRFASFRMSELVIRYVGQYQELGERDKAAATFKLAALLETGSSLFAYLLIWLLAPLGARYFSHDSNLTLWYLIYGSVVLANFMYESSTGLLQVLDKFFSMSVILALQSAVTLVIIGVAYITKGGLISVVFAYLIGKIVGVIGTTALALIQASKVWGRHWWCTPLRSVADQRRSLLTFAFSTNFSGTISLVAKDSEVLWVSAFLGTIEAGYYKLALSLVNLLQLPVSPMPITTYPELSREVARKSWANVRYVLRQGSLLSGAYSVPVTLALILFGRWVIATVYDPSYLPAYPALVLLLFGYTFVNIFYWNRVALLALSHPVFPTVVNFVGMVLKIGAIFLLVSHFGYLTFAGLLSAYYGFTVGLAVIRVIHDLRTRSRFNETT
ncbi:MAG: oligosaccharide flippase family protein [Chloroflexota bacterium]